MGMDIIGKGLSGALANQKEGSTDAGNAYGSVLNQLGGQGVTGDVVGLALGGQKTYGQTNNAAEVQSNPMLSGMFGQGGTMDQTIKQESDQANQPWALTDEDKSAYGQVSGDIARQFGQSDQSMSQALSDRGLSNSGVAGAAFSGAQGSKMEQLAGAQQKIASDRMKTNMQRLGQTQQFLGTLGQQANTALNSQSERGIAQADQSNKALNNRAGMMMGLTGKFQDQQNEGLEQRQQTAHGSNFSNTVNGAMQGKDAADAKVGSLVGGMSKK